MSVDPYEQWWNRNARCCRIGRIRPRRPRVTSLSAIDSGLHSADKGVSFDSMMQDEVKEICERALRSAAKLRRQAEQLAADLARFRVIHPSTKGEQS
jgi:hypothetical protein